MHSPKLKTNSTCTAVYFHATVQLGCDFTFMAARTLSCSAELIRVMGHPKN